MDKEYQDKMREVFNMLEQAKAIVRDVYEHEERAFDESDKQYQLSVPGLLKAESINALYKIEDDLSSISNRIGIMSAIGGFDVSPEPTEREKYANWQKNKDKFEKYSKIPEGASALLTYTSPITGTQFRGGALIVDNDSVDQVLYVKWLNIYDAAEGQVMKCKYEDISEVRDIIEPGMMRV